MGTTPERNPDGSANMRYDEPISREPQISLGDSELIEAVENHLQAHFGDRPDGKVFHEIVSPTVHLDVHMIPPNDLVNGWTCMTSGMAELPMSPPPKALQEIGECRYLELVTILPPNWPMAAQGEVVAGPPDEHFWPISWMKMLARFPHDFGAWLWAGHTIPNGDPPERFPGTGFVGCMLHYPALLPETFWKLQAGDRTVHVMAIWPLYEREMSHKLRCGAESLFSRFEQHGVTEMIDPARRDTCRKRFGFM